MSEMTSDAPALEAVPIVNRADSLLSEAEQTDLAVRAERAEARGPKITRVVASRPLLRHRLLELWRSRELFVFLVRKDIKVRYKNSVLGFLWSMLNPALNLAVYWFVFQVVLRNGVPNFVIYLFSGLLAWNFFQTAILGSTGAVVGNAGLVKKVAFPREILALANVGSAFMFFIFQSIVMLGFMLVLHHSPDWEDMWLLIPALAAIVVFAAALSIFLSAVNVYLRDTQHLVEVGITAWFWAAPVVYSYNTQIRPHLHTLEKIIYFSNPVTPIVMSFQQVLYARGTVPVATKAGTITNVSVLAQWPVLRYLWMDLGTLGASVGLFLIAMVIFGRLEGNFAEEL